MKKNLVYITFIFTFVMMFSCSSDDSPQDDPDTDNEPKMHTITSFSPTKGALGLEVTINGTDFSNVIDENLVKINGVPAEIVKLFASTTKLPVILPVGATTGKFSVTVNGKTVESDTDFTVVPLPTITSFSPESARAGEEVTITGTGFSTVAEENIVNFYYNIPAEVTAASETELTVIVPTDAHIGVGQLEVTVYDNRVLSEKSFILIDDLWTQKASYEGSGPKYATGFSIGNKGYIGTGWQNAMKADFWEYDPETDAWTQKADFGGGERMSAVGFSIGDKGYIGLGTKKDSENPDLTEDVKDVWEYDPAVNAWTQKADFGGVERSDAVSFVIGSKAYVGTGHYGVYRKDFWEYDPAVDAWTQIADFGSSERSRAVAFSIDDKGYVGTGFSVGGRTKDFWEYNASTDEWTQVADFAGGTRTSATAFVINSKAYVGTGSGSNTYEKDFWVFDPATNEWMQKNDMENAGRSDAVSFSIGEKGYVGLGNINTGYTRSFWEYQP